MRHFKLLIIILLIPVYAAGNIPEFTKLHIAGDSIPTIRHMIEMKMSGDSLWFVYESEESYGQQILRKAIVDLENNRIVIGPEIGKQPDGYYVSYMPYPLADIGGTTHAIGRDDCEFYDIENDTILVRTKEYLMGENFSMPYTLSRYIKDVYTTDKNKYVFVGREPKGGRQFALAADLQSAQIDSIRQISISPDLQAWMPNAGEMAYSGKHKRIAFAYRLHPVIEIFGLDGSIIKTVEVGAPTFEPVTLEEADFEDLNSLHFVDITTGDGYIYALHRGHHYSERNTPGVNSSIYKIDWNGNIVNQYPVTADFQSIVVYNDNILIAWNGKEFVMICLQ